MGVCVMGVTAPLGGEGGSLRVMSSAEAGADIPLQKADAVVADLANARSDVADQEATSVFSKSILISAVRCLLAYVIFPFVAPLAPALGLANGFEGIVGLAIGAVAIVANLFSIRRFWAANHRWKVPITVLNVAVILLLLVLAARDLNLVFG